jgi:hypothetical protein
MPPTKISQLHHRDQSIFLVTDLTRAGLVPSLGQKKAMRIWKMQIHD